MRYSEYNPPFRCPNHYRTDTTRSQEQPDILSLRDQGCPSTLKAYPFISSLHVQAYAYKLISVGNNRGPNDTGSTAHTKPPSVNEKRPKKKAKTSVGNKHKAKTSKQTTIRKATTTTLETSDSEERTPPQKRKAPTTKAPKRQRTGASQDAQHTQILPPKGDAATEEEGGGRARQNKRKTKPKTTKEKKKKRTRNVNERRTTRTSETWTISCNQRRSQDTERQQEHRRKQRSNRTGAKIAMTQDNRHQQGGHSRGVHFTAPPPFLKKDSYSLCSRTLYKLTLMRVRLYA